MLVGARNRYACGCLTAFNKVLCTLNIVKDRFNDDLYNDVLSSRWTLKKTFDMLQQQETHKSWITRVIPNK